MYVDFLLEAFNKNFEKSAIISKGREYTYQNLADKLKETEKFLDDKEISKNSIVSLEADFCLTSVAMLLTLIDRGCVVVPLSDSIESRKEDFRTTAQVEVVIQIHPDETLTLEQRRVEITNELLAKIKKSGHPGLILFSSGSTGKSKAALHDLVPIFEKFKVQRKSKRMLSFLLFDHIGGFNTLLYSLSNVGTLVTVDQRTPQHVAELIEQYRVEVLPTSPTFLNLLLMSGVAKDYDLSSLELITYGTEPMPFTTLQRLREGFPSIELQQTYGLSELGILRSKSESSGSLWVKLGGEGFETRVVDGCLEIKAKSAMLGYLNAPSPFTEDGWFMTNDLVEVNGDYFRFLGRKSEVINVGGEKVFPAEIEGYLLRMAGVEEAVVEGEPNMIVGNIVKASVKLSSTEDISDFRVRMRKYFNENGIAGFKIPQKVILVSKDLHSQRFKKMRTV